MTSTDGRTASTPQDAHARAKRPRTPLAGPYGHPLHPILVTIPIGVWIASIVFDIIGFVADDPTPFVVGSSVLIIIGIIGAVLAAIWGLVDLSTLAAGTPARRTALTHMTLNLVIVVLFVVSLVARLSDDDNDHVNVFGFVVSLIAIIALLVSGWLGGRLAYHYGVRVADEVTQAEGFR